MAGSPKFKIHNPEGEYVGSAKYGEDAAAFVSHLGDGAKVKVNGRIVWREGAEEFLAGESFDDTAATMESRS